MQLSIPSSLLTFSRDWAHDTSNAVAQSGALDLEEVNDRLLRIAGQHEPKAEPMSPYRPGKSPTRSPSPPQRGETEFYFKLVNNGGRPMYPIELIDSVAQNPTAYRHLVRPWSDSADSELPEWWLVFERQSHHWEQFRQWQAHARREGIPPRVEIRFDTRWSHVDTAYDRFVRDFRLESPTYADAALQLLGRHGFTRPVQFHPDVSQQDKLTEWIEYLTYECAVLHWYTCILQRGQPKYNKAWKTLVDSNVLRPFETEKFIWSSESGITHQTERQKAERAVELAESALEASDKIVDRHSGSAVARAQKMSAARSRLDEAKESLQLVQRRNGLIIDFKRTMASFFHHKKDLKQQEVLVRWVLNEVPRVEAELGKDGMENVDLNPRCGTHATAHANESDDLRPAPGRTRKRGCDETADDEPSSKRRKSGGREMDSCEARSLSISTAGTTSRPRRRRDPRKSSCLPPKEDARPPLRRSARIAARKLAQTQAATLSRPRVLDAPDKAGNGAQQPTGGRAVRQRRRSWKVRVT
jgi:hypothetical protein